MEPTIFYVGIYFLVSLLQLASSRVDNYGGWNNSPDTQYHIQTDEGDERYFKYQTKSGQYRKEKRLPDGTVVGTYGWVDPEGFLRLRDYVADNSGYRVVKSQKVYVGNNPEPKPGYQGKYASSKPKLDQSSRRSQFGYVPPSTYHPNPGPYLGRTTPQLPQVSGSPQLTFEPYVYHNTPASTYLSRPGQPSPLARFLSSSTPAVDVSPNSLPKSPLPTPASDSVPLYPSPTSLVLSSAPGAGIQSSTPASSLLRPSSASGYPSSIGIQSSTPVYQPSTPSNPLANLPSSAVSSSEPVYPSTTPSYSPSTYETAGSYQSNAPSLPSSPVGNQSPAAGETSPPVGFQSSTVVHQPPSGPALESSTPEYSGVSGLSQQQPISAYQPSIISQQSIPAYQPSGVASPFYSAASLAPQQPIPIYTQSSLGPQPAISGLSQSSAYPSNALDASGLEPPSATVPSVHLEAKYYSLTYSRPTSGPNSEAIRPVQYTYSSDSVYSPPSSNTVYNPSATYIAFSPPQSQSFATSQSQSYNPDASPTPSSSSASSNSPVVSVLSTPTPTPVAAHATTPKPVAAVNYVQSSPEESEAALRRAQSAPPVSGKFLPYNYITESEKRRQFLREGGYRKRYVDSTTEQEYDGVSTVQGGFRYYLPRHYHEEQSSSDGRERAGSYGYIDPFGIRRVVYYNTSPEGGFVHKKNNRYVGFNATPYDPRP